MVGYLLILMIVDVYLKYLMSVGIDDIWIVLMIMQCVSVYGFDQYCQCGYVFVGDNVLVLIMQDYVFDDWVMVVVGKVVGKSMVDYQFYLMCSQNYWNVFNLVLNNGWKFLQLKDVQGNWVVGFDLMVVEKIDFFELNLWVDMWNIFYDFLGLIMLFGGISQFVVQFDCMFDLVNLLIFQYNQGFLDLIGCSGQYFVGNELVNYLLYLYDVVGMLLKMQDCVCMVMDDMYLLMFMVGDCVLLSGDSLKVVLNDLWCVCDVVIFGNDDCGQLFVWYVLFVFGIYLLNLVGGVFYFGMLLFEEVLIDILMVLGSGVGGVLKFGGV